MYYRINQLLLIITGLLISGFSCYGQQEFLKPSIKVGNRIYLCTPMDDYIFVQNKANVELGRIHIPSGSDNLASINFSNINELIPIYNAIFSKSQIQQLLSEKEMTINFSIDDHGTIMQLAFGLSRNTRFRPEQLSELEDQIKSKTRFSFYNNDFKGANFIRFNYTVPFKKIYEGKKLINVEKNNS